jgi:cytochrome c551/c552
MRIVTAITAGLGVLLLLVGGNPSVRTLSMTSPVVDPATPPAALWESGDAADISHEDLTAVVQRTCVACHNDALLTGGMSLQGYDVAAAATKPELTEKMIRKLRAGMMPPPGMPRPTPDTMLALVETLESVIDQAADKAPNAGDRPFQRLNRAEYESSIKALLGMEIRAGDYLPLDTKSENFDNIADVQVLSPTLLDAYLNAAAEISRLAVGDPEAAPGDKNYEKGGYNSQWDRVEGAPYGTRGGISVTHIFPADGEYVFKMAFDHTTTGGFQGRGSRYEKVEISIDGAPAVVVLVDQWMTVSDPNHVNQETEPVFVRAGPHRVSAVFIQQFEGPIEDLTSPHEWSLADREIGSNGNVGITQIPHLKDLTISGPYRVTGVSDTPIRQRIFSCRPITPTEERPCAEGIVKRLGTQAFRRTLSAEDLSGLMAFYDLGSKEGGFELGVRTALQAILASPDFYFRFEPAAGRIRTGENYRLAGEALASRLSFFIWGAPPDEELLALASRGRLSDSRTLEQQTRRLLADSRSEALATRFAAQWLRLQDLDKIHPDVNLFPDYNQQLADAMRRETELFFYDLVRGDKSFLDLYSADYTFANERLARHYGLTGITGEEFQRVTYPDGTRRGILGQGSVLTLTSIAGRTSPVLRGKWVMEVLMGTPPPPPPPGVPQLDQTGGAVETRVLTTRERMEIHRNNEQCRSCHQFMDPIGLALDNFDVTGKFRIRENGMPLDTRGQLYDGTQIQNLNELQQALLKRPTPLVRTFTQNLMAYAFGRRIEWYDQPTVRAIASEAEKNDFRISSFVLGVVKSDPFQMKRAGDVAAEQGTGSR